MDEVPTGERQVMPEDELDLSNAVRSLYLREIAAGRQPEEILGEISQTVATIGKYATENKIKGIKE